MTEVLRRTSERMIKEGALRHVAHAIFTAMLKTDGEPPVWDPKTETRNHTTKDF